MRVIETYNQNDFSDRFDHFHIDSHGVCAAMTAMYLLMHSRGEDYWAWQKTEEGQNYVLNIHGSHKEPNQYMAEVAHIWDRMKRLGSTNNVDSNKGLKWCLFDAGRRDMEVRGNGDFIWFCLATEAMAWIPGGGHAMAIKRSRPIRFMDPNHGEWEFISKGEFAPWLRKHLRKEWGPRLKRARAEVQWMDANRSDRRPPPPPVIPRGRPTPIRRITRITRTTPEPQAPPSQQAPLRPPSRSPRISSSLVQRGLDSQRRRRR